MARKEIEAFMAEYGLRVGSEFLPFSSSRNAGEKHRSLNWKVTLRRDTPGRSTAILTTDYMAGMAHCPSYPKGGRLSVYDDQRCAKECEYGYALYAKGAEMNMRRPILPDPCDVLSSLALDASILDAGSFEDWASEFGYDPDSRKAEATYRACLEIALKLRQGLGDEGLRKLQEAAQDY